MKEYTPIFSKEKEDTIVLDNAFAANNCMQYAKKHNYSVVMTNTSSTCFAKILMLFQKNGFDYKLYECEVYAVDGTHLDPEVRCLFEKVEKVK